MYILSISKAGRKTGALRFLKLILLLLMLYPVTDISAVENHNSENDPMMLHLTDHNFIDIMGFEIPLPVFKPVTINGRDLNISITSDFVFFWIGTFLIIIVLSFYKKNQIVQKKFMGRLVETLVLFVRDDIVRPVLPHDYKKYLPFFLTLFMVIFMQNFIGLIPFMSGSTKNLSVTAALAVITFSVVISSGIKKFGILGYLKNFLPLSFKENNFVIALVFNILLAPFEFMGILTKPFALSIRLFANIVAGHAVILTFLLIGWGGKELGWNYFVIAPSVAASVFIYLLECLVAFLQAYVFTLLSAIFISEAIEHSH
ncbi:MAG: F0F1 ATP synthase subunit A [Spirochaetes bacterium]|nr:F0F1 ATP synthase subunit A [Spirochaetota bacterium]